MNSFRQIQDRTLTPLGPSRAMRGFTLLEMSIVLLMGSAFVISITLSQHTHMLQLRAQAMAQRYKDLHAGVQRYMEIYRTQLSALPVDCSQPAYRAGSPKPPGGAVAAGNCSLNLMVQGQTVRVSNALQPSTRELLALGLLDAGAPVTLALDREVRVFNPAFASSLAVLAPEQLGVLVRKLCDSVSCTGQVALESLVYNLQPYLLKGGNWAFDRSDQVRVLMEELGDGAALSQSAQQGMLVGATFQLNNPVQESDGQGMLGIVALRASTNTTLDALWARRDGQSAIAGDWNFSSYKLKGVSNLDAQTVQAQDLTLSGKAALNAASAQSLAVERFQTQNLRLPGVQAGQVCDPNVANLALDSSTAQLLTCRSDVLVWSAP